MGAVVIEASQINDSESLQSWLEALPQGIEAERSETQRWAVVVAHRASMRVLSELWAWTLSGDKLARDLSVFPFLRFNLISGIAGECITPEIKLVAAEAAGSRDDFGRGLSLAFSNARSAFYAAHAAADSVEAVVNATESATAASRAADADAAAYVAAVAMWGMIREDCAALMQRKAPEHQPLWKGKDLYAALWNNIRPIILDQGDGWRFWVEWYENALYGWPQDWELLRKIAHIDPNDWEKGADHVNALIADIIEVHRLASEARALKREIARLKAELQSVQHRGHNNPPELIDEAIAAQREVAIIWAALDEAETELEKPQPDRSKLAEIGQMLINALIAGAAYCGALADVAVKTSVKTASASATALIVATQHERLHAFAEALIQFAHTFGN